MIPKRIWSAVGIGLLAALAVLDGFLVLANQAGIANYDPAPTPARAVPIDKADQIITFLPIGNKFFGSPAFIVSATASSGLPVSFSASGNCTIAGRTVTVTGVGSCTVTASQTGNANYHPAPGVARAVTIDRADQIVIFLPLGNQVFRSPAFSVSATASSGLPVSFSAGGNCTIAGSTVTVTGIGSCTVTASQTGNANYHPAPSVARAFQIGKGDQIITFLPIANKVFGSPAFIVSATASSGLPVSFSASGNCTIAGSTVTITGRDSCTITASQGGNSDYSPAPDVSRTFTSK